MYWYIYIYIVHTFKPQSPSASYKYHNSWMGERISPFQHLQFFYLCIMIYIIFTLMFLDFKCNSKNIFVLFLWMIYRRWTWNWNMLSLGRSPKCITFESLFMRDSPSLFLGVFFPASPLITLILWRHRNKKWCKSGTVWA